MDKKLECNISSDRSRKARFAQILDRKAVRIPVILTLFAACLLWLWFGVVSAEPVVHIFSIVIAALGLLLGWYYGELRRLEINLDDTNDVSGRLDRDLLGKLPHNHTIEDLVSASYDSNGGRFFTNRFLIFEDDIKKSLDSSSIELSSVWKLAIDLSSERNSKELSSAAVVAAIILLLSDRDIYLASRQLDEADIRAGVDWYEHAKKSIDHHLSKKQTGGVGRDLSFGWAPLLNKIGFNISDSIQRHGSFQSTPKSRDAIVDQIIHVLAQAGRRNVALIGDVGVGRTTIVHTLADRLIENPKTVPDALKFRQIIELDAAHIIQTAQNGISIEQLMIRIFNEALTVKNVILFFDNAELFFKDGTGSLDLSNIILPLLQGGSAQIIFSLTDQQWQVVNQRNPEMAQLLNRVIVKPLDKSDTIRVMQAETLLLEAKYKVTYTYKSLHAAYKFAERYIRDQAFPGRAIKLLESATGFAEHTHFITERSVAEAIERTYDVRVQAADTAQEKDTLLNLESKIHERMINQSRAVKLVSDALRRARTGVSSEGKPIGTFLFLGPTGVGKTELSKSLAEIYFNGEDRLIRIDMNEFSRPDDTARLVEVAARNQHSLVAQITKQPFSVVLLDEIEKAHPNVLDMLLQLLDEGMLKDAENKPVSFRDAIIIATSNAGADKIRAFIDAGQALEEFEKPFVDQLIDSKLFKPEFLNRFDEIVVFRPLTQEELLQVVDLLVSSLNKRLAVQKISITLSDEAKLLLVKNGYDPRLGARPLKRTVQRAVENLVSERMLKDELTSGQAITVSSEELEKFLDDRQK